MISGQRVNVRLEAKNKIVVLRAGRFLCYSKLGAIVKLDRRGEVLEVELGSVWTCSECGGPAEMRFKRELWCLDCFEIVHNTPEPDRVENHISMPSAISRTAELIPAINGVNASDFNVEIAKKKKKKKIPTMDPKDWRSRVIAP